MLSKVQNLFRPSHGYVFDDTQKNLAELVGYIGVLMPLLLMTLNWRNACDYNSISHYYYAVVAGDALVGCLFVIAAIVIFYKGKSPLERWLTVPAGIFAIGVAIFPTDGAGCERMDAYGRYFATYQAPSGDVTNYGLTVAAEPYDAIFRAVPYSLEIFGYELTLHYLCAGLLFLSLALYSVFVFPQVDRAEHCTPGTDRLTTEKICRNAVYYAAAALIAISMIAIAAKPGMTTAEWDAANLTFYFEWLGLGSFGASWLMRGRFYRRFGL